MDASPESRADPAGSVPAADEPSSIEATVAGLTRAEAALSAVDRALATLDAGTYGRCAACGEQIDDAGLANDPTLVHCVTHRHSA